MSIRANILANYFGQAWVALMSIAFVPIYINELGIEAYGLIGIYTLLQTWISILDLGITPTIIREIAKLKSGEHSTQSIGNLIYSLETIVYSLAILIIGMLWLCSPLLAHHWLNSSSYSELTLTKIIQVIALVVAARFCEGIYRGHLIGSEKHITLNLIQFVSSTIKFGGAAILVSHHPSIMAFFAWQAGVSFMTVVFYKTSYVLHIKKQKFHFSITELKKIKNFAGGMTATTILALVFSQADKVLVSKFDNLGNFGSYILAFTVSGILPMVIYPIVSTISPKLNNAVSLKNKAEEEFLFSNGAQISTIISTSIFATCCFCSHYVISAWTNNDTISNAVAPLLSWVIVGAYCNSLLLIPFALQQAHGWTTLSVRVNLIGACFLLPTAYFGLKHYGTIGAAFAWALSNILIFFFATFKMHKVVLEKQLNFFILKVLIQPLAIGYIISTLANILLTSFYFSRPQTITILTGTLLINFVFITLTLPIRKQMLALIKIKTKAN